MNQAGTVSLQNVRMLGTEGRRGAGQQEILPNNQVYSFIEFRATDILELQVIDEAPPAFQDPAIVSRSPPVPRRPWGTGGACGLLLSARGSARLPDLARTTEGTYSDSEES